jgi:hypothetical protein
MIILSIVFCLNSCREKRPPSEAEINHFIAVYTDYLSVITADTSKLDRWDGYMKQALQSHNMKKADFDRVLEHLMQDSEAMNSTLDKMLPNLFPDSTEQ